MLTVVFKIKCRVTTNQDQSNHFAVGVDENTMEDTQKEIGGISTLPPPDKLTIPWKIKTSGANPLIPTLETMETVVTNLTSPKEAMLTMSAVQRWC